MVRNPIKASVAALAAVGLGVFVAQAVPTHMKNPASPARELSGSSSAAAYDAIRYDPGPTETFIDAALTREPENYDASQSAYDPVMPAEDPAIYTYPEDIYQVPDAKYADFAALEQTDPQAVSAESAAAAAAVAAQDAIVAEREGTLATTQ